VISRAVSVKRSPESNEVDFQSIASELRSCMADSNMRTQDVVVGIPRDACMLRYANVEPVPNWRLDLIMNYEVESVAERMGEPLTSAYRTLSLPRELDEDQTVLLALAKDSELGNLLDSLESEGITVAKAVPQPLALLLAYDMLGRRVDPSSEDDDVTLVADVGSTGLDVIVLLNGRLAFARSTTFGGTQFTEALAGALNVSVHDAEKLKIKRGGLDRSEAGVLGDSVAPLRKVAAQLLTMLEASLRMAGGQKKKLPPLTGIVLLGGGARIRGLPSFVSQRMKVPVSLLKPRGLTVDNDEEIPEAIRQRPGDAAVSLGLALSKLQGSSNAGTIASVSLLPSKFLNRRRFKERTVYLYVAAACLVVLLVGRLGFGFVRNREARWVYDANEQAYTALSMKHDEHLQEKSREEAARARLNRLLLEAEQTAFQAFVLEFLGSRLRAEIYIEGVQLEVDPKKSADESYELHVKGAANNEKRDAIESIRGLLADLASEERIRSAEYLDASPDEDGGWYTFELVLKPNYVRY
ncbi:MAG: pilus assembly protein PilM, partial [Planctomycetes bacterium]|nr:pilus assembly protein PilM [Planctomycetota bacterium]